MKPILVLQHAHYDWPGYFTDCLINWEIPFELVNIAAGDALPLSIVDYSGFGIMGGGMSVHDTDEYPHLLEAVELIYEAMSLGIPVIGHCLGGQLLAKASGGTVQKAPHKEIGWHTVTPKHDNLAYQWFGGITPVTLFEWHNEFFIPPLRAHNLASSLYCQNQAFVLDDIHLGMQFHCEALPEKINHWLDTAREDLNDANDANVHSVERIQREHWQHIENAMAVARQLYFKWLSNVQMEDKIRKQIKL